MPLSQYSIDCEKKQGVRGLSRSCGAEMMSAELQGLSPKCSVAEWSVMLAR